MCSSAAPGEGGDGVPSTLPPRNPRPTTSTTTTTSTDVKMRRFTLPNLFLTVEGQDRQLEEICPGIYEYTGHPKSPRSPRSPKSPRSPRSTKSTSPNSPRAPHCQCHCPRLHRQDEPFSSSASPSPRRKRPPYSHILLGERKPSAGNLLATTFGIADRDAPTQSLPLIHEKEKEHARLVVERPEIKDTQAGFEALGGRCESCGTCTDSCLKKLGLEHEDGSRSPSSISPKSEKMYTFFEKSLSLVSSSPTRFGDHLVPREKRSHSLATPSAMANVVHFQELHSRHAESHLLRTVNMAASNAVLSRISARLKAVTTATQQESVEEVDEEVEAQAAAATPGRSHHHHHHHHHHSNHHNHHHHCHSHGHHSGATTPQDAASSHKKPHGGTTPTTSTATAAFPSLGSNAQGKVNATASDAGGGDTPTQAKDGASPPDDAPSPGNPGKEEGLKEAEDHKSKNGDMEGKATDEAKEAATEKSTDDVEKPSGKLNDSSPHAEEEEATPEAQNTDGDESAT